MLTIHNGKTNWNIVYDGFKAVSIYLPVQSFEHGEYVASYYLDTFKDKLRIGSDKSGILVDNVFNDCFLTYDNVVKIVNEFDMITGHRGATKSEIKYGQGVIHYRDFQRKEWVKQDGITLKNWILSKDDELRYYR